MERTKNRFLNRSLVAVSAAAFCGLGLAACGSLTAQPYPTLSEVEQNEGKKVVVIPEDYQDLNDVIAYCEAVGSGPQSHLSGRNMADAQCDTGKLADTNLLGYSPAELIHVCEEADGEVIVLGRDGTKRIMAEDLIFACQTDQVIEDR